MRYPMIRIYRHAFRLGLHTYERGIIYRFPGGLYRVKGKRTN